MNIGSQKLTDFIEPMIKKMGYELWHLDIHGSVHKQNILRIYIDIPQSDNRTGISLSDCEYVSNQISTWLEVEGVISGAYTLEVSSCGLERCLYKPEHYARYIGSKIEITLRQPWNGSKRLVGKLLKVSEKLISLSVCNDKSKNSENKVIDFGLADICKSKLISEDFRVK